MQRTAMDHRKTCWRYGRAVNLRCGTGKVKSNRHSCGLRLALLTTVAWSIAACTGWSPAARLDAYAARAGLELGEVEGHGFRHRTFAAPGSLAGPSRRLHVYFEGDGTPFLRGTEVTADPSPRRPLALDLMRRDQHAAVLLGRPCYHGLTDGCKPELWTVGRYSEAVVASMTAATARLIREHDEVVLIGYSGGGVLALLVAERLDDVTAVVTLAANLDLTAWVEHHGYSPLITSIDPARIGPGRGDLRQLHLTGAADDNVPPDVQRSLAERSAPGTFRTLPDFDHRCCWVETWPHQLAGIDRWLAQPVNGQR